MQVSIRGLLALTAFAATVCGLFFGLPDKAAVMLIPLFCLLSVPASVAGAVFGRRYARAFCVGWLTLAAPYAVKILFFGEVFDQFLSLFPSIQAFTVTPAEALMAKWTFATLLGFAALFGLSAVAARWLVTPREIANQV